MEKAFPEEGKLSLDLDLPQVGEPCQARKVKIAVRMGTSPVAGQSLFVAQAVSDLELTGVV